MQARGIPSLSLSSGPLNHFKSIHSRPPTCIGFFQPTLLLRLASKQAMWRAIEVQQGEKLYVDFILQPELIRVNVLALASSWNLETYAESERFWLWKNILCSQLYHTHQEFQKLRVYDCCKKYYIWSRATAFRSFEIYEGHTRQFSVRSFKLLM